MKKRVISIITIFTIFMNMVPSGVMAAEQDDTKVCSHHPIHTADCGYVEEIEETPCTHVCTEECMSVVTQCIHEHTQECYSGTLENEDEETGEETAQEQETASDEETAGHDDEQPSDFDKKTFGGGILECAHVCSIESGCIIEIQHCQHEHNEECGYSEAVEGHLCGYICKICPVQELIDALPEKVTKENREEVSGQLDAILEKYQELTQEEQEQIDLSHYEEIRDSLEKEPESDEDEELIIPDDEEIDAPYYLFIVHSLDVYGEPYGSTELIELNMSDFIDEQYDLRKHALEKEGMKTVRSSYFDKETYDLTEGWVVSMSDFEMAGDPEDDSAYYAVQVLMEYEVAQGYRAVVSSSPSPVDDPYGIMLLVGFTGGNIVDITFEPANIVNITVRFMYSPTGGLSGMPAAESRQYQVVVEKGKSAQAQWDIPYAGSGSYQNLEGFRIVLNPKPLNAFLVNPALADEMTDHLDAQKVKDALENDLFTIDTSRDVYRLGMTAGGTYGNIYSDAYNQAWNEARTITGGSGLYTAKAASESNTGGSGEGANPLTSPKLTVTIPESQVSGIFSKLAAISNAGNAAEKERLQKELDDSLTVTVYYRRNAGSYKVVHWAANLPADQQSGKETQVKNGTTYYKVYEESKQGRVGAMTNAVPGTDMMEKEGVDNWISAGRFDFTSYVTEGFGQKIIESGDRTTVDIFYTSASVYRVIFNTDDTYIPRVQADLNDTLLFNYSGNGSLSIKDTEGSTQPVKDYRNPLRAGYQFEGWRYEVIAGSGIAGAYPEDGKYYVDITDQFQIDGNKIDKDLLVLANDADSTVKAIYLYPRWSPNKANVRVVFWTEDLSGGEKDVKVSVENAPSGGYLDKVGTYLNGTPDTVGASFSNMGSFSFTATAEQILKLSVSDKTLKSMGKSNLFTVKDAGLPGGSKSGTLAEIIDAMFKVRMPDVKTSFEPVDSCEFYHPYQVNKENEAEITVAADGSTVINVYYARNVYSVDFTYYGMAPHGSEKFQSIAWSTNGYSLYSLSEEAKTTPLSYDVNTPSNWGGSNRNSWYKVDKTEVINQIVPEKVTITAKYGADIREVWPVSNYETVKLDHGSFKSATFISWGTTAGQYNAKYQDGYIKYKGTDEFEKYEPTLMGIYGAMSADIVADPREPGTVHHMYAYWWHRNISYYQYNHCYDVPGLMQEELLKEKEAGGVKTCDLTEREFGNSVNAVEMSVTGEEADRRNTLYLVPVKGSSLTDYFEDYSDALVKVDGNGNAAENGQYYAVRCYEGGVYALAQQIDAPSSDTIERQNPSARMHLTRVNTIADHDVRARDDIGNGNNTTTVIGSKEQPYDLFFYYKRDYFTITYVVPARGSSTGEYTLGTRQAPYGSSLSRYKVDLDNSGNQIKKFYSNNNVFRDFWNPSAENKGLGEGVNSSGYARVVPNSAVDGTGIWDFGGWALDRVGSEKLEEGDWKDAVTGDLRLFAMWEEPGYKVTFKLEGGIVPGGGTADVVYTNIRANQGFTSSGNSIPRPIKNGYILSGWDWYKDGTTLTPVDDFTFETPVIQDMVAVARWTTFQAKNYNYKIWYLTNDPDAVRKTGEGWISASESGNPGRDNKPPAGLKSGYSYVLGCEFFSRQKYPEGTSLLLGAKGFDGYIPYNGNATIELKAENPNASAGNTGYIAYFYYDKVQTKKYEIYFQPVKISDGSVDGGVLADILQKGETDKAYFTPSEESFQALKEAGYQLVQMNEDGTVVMEDGKPKAAQSFADLKDFIEEKNQEFADWNNSKPMEITFKVVPIPYTITYKVGALKAEGQEVSGSSELMEAMKKELEKLENAENGGVISGDEFQNPTVYYVNSFKGNFSFTLKNPIFVQNPVKEGEWWKFTGWSTGAGTTAVNTSRSGGGGEYSSLTIHQSVGDLVFQADWERVDTGIARIDINFEKQLNGRSFQTGDSFTFTLTAAEDAPVPKDVNGVDVSEVTITPGSGDRADVPFGSFYFDQEGVYKYTLEEKLGSISGMTYDTVPKVLTITVKNEGGVLTATADTASVKWINTYKVSDSPQEPEEKKEKDSGGGSDETSESGPVQGAGTGESSDADSASEHAVGSALPQTGMLWWPVWLLIIAGVVMLGVGIVRKKGSGKSHEE